MDKSDKERNQYEDSSDESKLYGDAHYTESKASEKNDKPKESQARAIIGKIKRKNHHKHDKKTVSEEERCVIDRSIRNTGPPPAFIPQTPAFGNGSKGIANCLCYCTYIWQFNGMSYWFYPIEMEKRAISGYIWFRKKWSPHRISKDSIRAHYRLEKK